MKAQTVTLIGVNRASASIGLALKASPLEMVVVGYDADRARAEEAKEIKAIDKTDWNLISAVSKADILVLALSAAELQETMPLFGEDVQPHALVLDFSSLKGQGIALANKHLRRGHYVGVQAVLSAAALADGRSTVSTAQGDMFRDSVFCLMPAPQADPKAVETAVNFGRILGGTPYFVDPHEYDSLLQGITTIPGLMAAIVFSTVNQATGWRDILRFADLPFALTTAPLQDGAEITHLALNNKQATLRWLDAFMNELKEIRRLVEQEDGELLLATLTDLQYRREKWLHERSENNWVEIPAQDVQSRSLPEQMLGGWLGGKRKKE
ncbi:MAG: prephenate dehydrogenase/arogenate dehydrogenase family protein [Chloroflexota bacterium]